MTLSHRKHSFLPFSLLRPSFTELCCEAPGCDCGLEDAIGRLLGTGVISALERGAVGVAVSGVDLFAGVAAGVLLKKPARVCCLGPGFWDELPVFLGAGRGVAISLPSMPRAMFVQRPYSV